eukprot:TRINITY_DN1753_c0_g1_i1.p1 TRINITY_DN1753_c0_g1~~TRINITY_DN1753_c0_g1_i1.p1  ORF type:complete len:116 (+),score=30.41 TRINITY_DN1753_c0_g1_i1:278-625(+)
MGGKQDVSDVSSQDQREYNLGDYDSKRTELQSPDPVFRNMNVQYTRVSEKTDKGSALDSGRNRGRPTEKVNRIQNKNPWRELWPNISLASYSTSRKKKKYRLRGRSSETAKAHRG